MTQLKAPFPWYGGKSRSAHVVWQALGDVDAYVEPFAGSLAVALARPGERSGRKELYNDLDGFVVNFWRAAAWAPDEVVRHATWPATESDLVARHAYLIGLRRELTGRLQGDPRWYDPEVAGWWLWGVRIWIGSGWCGRAAQQRPEVMYATMARDVSEDIVRIAERLRSATILCGDWWRCLTRSILLGGPTSPAKLPGLVGVFLDPPYMENTGRQANLYAVDSGRVARAVRDWCSINGAEPKLRIVLAGLRGEHRLPGWREVDAATVRSTAAHGIRGGSAGRRADHETLWLSPHCMAVDGG